MRFFNGIRHHNVSLVGCVTGYAPLKIEIIDNGLAGNGPGRLLDGFPGSPSKLPTPRVKR